MITKNICFKQSSEDMVIMTYDFPKYYLGFAGFTRHSITEIQVWGTWIPELWQVRKNINRSKHNPDCYWNVVFFLHLFSNPALTFFFRRGCFRHRAAALVSRTLIGRIARGTIPINRAAQGIRTIVPSIPLQVTLETSLGRWPSAFCARNSLSYSRSGGFMSLHARVRGKHLNLEAADICHGTSSNQIHYITSKG